MVKREDEESTCQSQIYIPAKHCFQAEKHLWELQSNGKERTESSVSCNEMCDEEERCPKRRKTTRRRKCSEISNRLRRWKSLPDHLNNEDVSHQITETKALHETIATHTEQSQSVTEHFPDKRQPLFRTISTAQVEYALIRAAIKDNNRLDLLDILNRKHDDINALGTDGFAALHHAAMIGTRKVIDMLVCFGAKMNTKNADGDYPLDLAVRAGNYDIAQYLIEKGACLENIINGTPPTKHRQRKMGRSHTISSIS